MPLPVAALFIALFALFGRDHRSTTSRFLAALCQAPVGAWHATSLPAKSPDAVVGVTLRERLQSAGPDRVQSRPWYRTLVWQLATENGV